MELAFAGGSLLLRGRVFLAAPARRWRRCRRKINSSGLFLTPLVSALGVNGEAKEEEIRQIPVLESMAGGTSSYSGDVFAGPFAKGCGAAVG